MSFIEGEDFYYDDNGLMVLTAAYLKRRGHCCHSDCRHCPYKDEADRSDVPFELKEVADDPYAKYIEQADQESDKDD